MKNRGSLTSEGYLRFKIFIVSFFVFLSLIGHACYADNFGPRNTAPEKSATKKDEAWTRELRRKMDKAIGIMKIIKEDINDLEDQDIAEDKASRAKQATWGENARENIDKMVKVMNIIKEDVGEFEKLDGGEVDIK
ncbi:MAG: hypothetical protein ABID09_04985 [Candidatus Omnitrophota bacterium]